jgi:hypothetical protein
MHRFEWGGGGGGGGGGGDTRELFFSLHIELVLYQASLKSSFSVRLVRG